MPSATETTNPFYIPSVDISPYLVDSTSPEARKVIEDIRAAFLSTGFFQLLGHQVPRSLQQEVFNGSKKFFSLPMDTKLKVQATKASGFKGYDVLASQSYQADNLPDMKEGYFSGHPWKPHEAQVVAKRFMASPNVWPSEDVLAAEEFKEPMERYYEAMLQLMNTVLDLIAATLPFGPHVFDEMRANTPACPLRLLHYPPTPPQQAGAKKQQGASEHTDFGAVALLLQDANPGLEVLDRNTGNWVLVPPNPDAYVVNLGDMMKKLLGGLGYQSTMHRVINKSSADRYSIVFFFDGNVDFKLRPLGDEVVDEKDVMTVEEYMMNRVKFSWGRHALKNGIGSTSE